MAAADITHGPIRVAGLRELDRYLGIVSTRLRAELTTELRSLARDVRDVARGKATAQGLGAPGESGRGRGDLVRKLSYSVRGGIAFITEGAYRAQGRGAPYKYPAVYEFSRSRARPFLIPALEDSRALIMLGMEHAVERATREL